MYTTQFFSQENSKLRRLVEDPKNKKTIIGVVIALVLTVAAIGFFTRTHHHAGAMRKLLVTSPWRSNEDITQQYVGQIRAYQHIELRALERGYLNDIFVDEGQSVKKGQKLFRIMPLINQAEFKKADAETQLAKIEYDNTAVLAGKQVVSDNELALAKAKLDKAKASKELAKVHLDLTELKAPFDGIVGRFMVRLGSLVDEGALLSTLSDNSKMWVYFNVSESEYLDYRSHAQDSSPMVVHLAMANGQLFEFPGKVETIEADFNNETGNIAFRATFPNPKSILRHGETGNVRVTVPLKNALVIPQKATFDILDKKFVYVVDKDGIVKSRELVIAEEMSHLYVVTSGLAEDERILFEGLGKVKQGDKIEADYLEPSKAIAQLNVPAQ